MRYTKNEKILIALINDARIQYVFLSFFLYLFCVVEYQDFVIGKFQYMGFRDHFSLIKSIVSSVIFLGSSLLVFLNTSSFIKGFSALIHLLFLMPILIVYQYDYNGGIFVSSILLLLALLNTNIYLRLPKVKLLKQKEVPAIMLIISVLFFIPFLISYKINFNSAIFLFGKEVYEIRAAIKNDGNVFLNYLLSPLVQVVFPILAIYGLAYKKIIYTFIAIALSVLLYMMIPQKSIFFGIFVVVFFYFFKNPLKKVATFAALLLFVAFVGLILTYSYDSLLVESLFLRRYLIIPAYLNNIYYEFFDGKPLMYSYSFLKDFFVYPYNIPPENIIGGVAFGSELTNANNGFVSDTFMNLGKVGVFVSVFIVAFIIKMFDSLSINAKFFGLFFLLLNLLRSSALPTIFVTHGLWLFFLLAFFVLRNSKTRIPS